MALSEAASCRRERGGQRGEGDKEERRTKKREDKEQDKEDNGLGTSTKNHR